MDLQNSRVPNVTRSYHTGANVGTGRQAPLAHWEHSTTIPLYVLPTKVKLEGAHVGSVPYSMIEVERLVYDACTPAGAIAVGG